MFESRIDRSNGHVIQMLTDDDLYKLTMAQFFLHQFPAATAKYRFKCRTANVDLLPFEDEIAEEIDHLCRLHYTKQELDYIARLRFIKPDFIEFLRLFQFNRDYITIGERDGKLDICAEGPIVHTTLFEIPVLKIVHEVYSRNVHGDEETLDEGRHRLEEKIRRIKEGAKRANLPVRRFLPIADFGSRRAYLGSWHEEVVCRAVEAGAIIGTSNVMLGMLYDTSVIGTMAHECFQAGQALGARLVDSQGFILQKWADEYRGDLGIALTDTLGIDKFLVDFDMYFAKLFDGVRHDSGDPIEWGQKIIEHYEKMRVDPVTKTAVFSDALDISRAMEIMEVFRGRIRVSFGIGTNLTNDVGPAALQNVMKMTECGGEPVAKIADDPEKAMCEDMEYQNYLLSVVRKDVARKA